MATRRSHPSRPQPWAVTFVFVTGALALVLVILGVPVVALCAGAGGLDPGIYRGWFAVILVVAVIVLAVGGHHVRAAAQGGADGATNVEVQVDG